MIIKTKFFGEIEIAETDIITFGEGIPGFLELRKFALVSDDSYFSYLQSLENESICFILIPPALIIDNYDIEISEGTVAKLEIMKPEDVGIYAIVSIPENVQDMTANLKAPILINSANNQGLQEVLDDPKYQVKHTIIKEAETSC